MTKSVVTIYNLINENSLQACCKVLSMFFDYIGPKGFLVMLGLRVTNRSIDDIPPKREKLVNEFNKPFGDKTKITVGARAVSKHSDRNKKNKFWGVVTGNEDLRNINSNKICLDIIANAVWTSYFNLSNSIKILEIRNKEGYGLRWDYSNPDKSYFKGLVEPNFEVERKDDLSLHKKNSSDSE